MTDAAVTEEFGQQQGQKGVQGRNGFRTGQARLTHRVGKIQSEQLWDEQKQARDLGGELPIGGQGPLLRPATASTSEPSRACSPGCGWARQRCPWRPARTSCNRRKEWLSLTRWPSACSWLQIASRVCPWRRSFAGTVADGVAFGRQPVAGWGSAEKLVEVGVLGEVAH